MTVSIHQPGYLPWHGYFHRLALSDVHVFLDTAQFEKHGFNNRVKVAGPGGSQWLTVPVRSRGRFLANPLSHAEIEQTSSWRETHCRTLRQVYARAPHTAEHLGFLDQFYARPWTRLVDMNIEAITYLAAAFGTTCRFVLASTLAVGGQKSALVQNICTAVGATTYLSGVNGRDYLDRAAFAAAGIAIRFQNYVEPSYQHSRGLAPYLSAVDLLFHCGRQSRSVMLRGQDSLATGSVSE